MKPKTIQPQQVQVGEVTLSILEEVGVTPNEIVDLSVGVREKNLLIAQKTTEDEIEDIERKQVQANAELGKLQKAEEKRLNTKAQQQARIAMTKIKQTGVKHLSLSQSASVDISPKISVAGVRINQSDPNDKYSSRYILLEYEYPANRDIRKKSSEIERLDSAHLEARKRLLHIKRDLANTSTHERIARGAIVRAKLMQTEKGRAVIKQLESIKDRIKAISYSEVAQ